MGVGGWSCSHIYWSRSHIYWSRSHIYWSRSHIYWSCSHISAGQVKEYSHLCGHPIGWVFPLGRVWQLLAQAVVVIIDMNSFTKQEQIFFHVFFFFQNIMMFSYTLLWLLWEMFKRFVWLWSPLLISFLISNKNSKINTVLCRDYNYIVSITIIG